MRILYFKITNYAGIYNGMGLNELEIDFSKCTHVITMISGSNGTGKSTLLKAINPLPDGTENFMDKLPVEKIMTIRDDEGNIFNMVIQSPVTSNGNRGATKAFIQKNGVELNTTGNVTSYKEIIFSEFDLDSNYITLSKLSGNDRGLADKTPSERKKFVGSILASIDAYNEMYKILTKKSNTYKTFINNLSTKIRTIGDEQSLQSKLSDLELRRQRLEVEKDKLQKKKTEEETYIKMIDPDGKIQNKYDELYSSIKSINGDITKAETKIESLKESLKDNLPNKDMKKNKKRLDDIYISYEKKIESDKATIESDRTRIESLIKEIDTNKGKLFNIKNGFEIDNLRESVRILGNSIESSQKILQSSEISCSGISRTEFETISATLTNIVNNIKVIYEKYSYTELSTAIETLLLGYGIDSVNKTSVELDDIIEDLTGKLHTKEIELTQVLSKIEDTEVLRDRPSKCKIDTCPFIVKALKYDKKNLLKQRDSLQKEINDISIKINDTKTKISVVKSSYQAIQDLENVMSQINNSKIVLDKLPICSIFTDNEELLNRIGRNDTFDEIININKYSELIDLEESLKTDTIKYDKLYAELQVAESKQESINLLESSIEDKEKELVEIREKDKNLNSNIEFNTGLSAKYKSLVDDMETLITEEDNLEKLRLEKERRVQEYRDIEDSIKKIKDYVNHLTDINGSLENIIHDLDPIQKEKDSVNFALTTVQSYYNELAQYQDKFNKVNTLKKYASPTSGIQTLYMDMYMGKTLTLANQLLAMLFSGEYKLLPYIINENEFRIPFIGNGLVVDDISSGSTSQICMIGMIMNLVILFQASTKYNIVFLDEIDGGLDTLNRGMFINTLYQLINILNVNHLVMISHNVESDLSNVDLIKLKCNGDDSSNYQNVNVIYDYEKDIRRK